MEFNLQYAVLTLMLTGIGLALLGVILTRIWRRDDVTSARLFWAGSDAAAHPERYVKPHRVLVVRGINLTAVSLFAGGVLIIVWATFRRL